MTTDDINYELGVDINSQYNFKNGDLMLIAYDDNLIQAIVNQLNTELNELDLFYEEYGSVILHFLGWKANDETLEFIKSELETVLKSEERLSSWEYELKYLGKGKLKIDLILYLNPNYSISTTLEITEDGVEEITSDEEEE